ncbi:MAG: hypothetical protein PHC97_01985 [Patescibacteria group bacterium]|nr:hypothetical protein [Patescibacteria group bacterium]
MEFFAGFLIGMIAFGVQAIFGDIADRKYLDAFSDVLLLGIDILIAFFILMSVTHPESLSAEMPPAKVAFTFCRHEQNPKGFACDIYYGE